MRIGTIVVALFFFSSLNAQKSPSVSLSEISLIEKTLASDQMQGRKVFTPGIEKAASYIEKEFKEAGLKPLPGSKNFRQSFFMADASSTEVTANLDGSDLSPNNIIVHSADSFFTVTAASNYQKVFIRKGDEFRKIVFKYLDADQNFLILVDTSFAKSFARLANFHLSQFEGSGNRVFILTSTDPAQYTIQVKQKITRQSLANIVGMIPGKSKPDEFVIFSSHYDHLGIGKPDASGDSLYNGANDNASGTTAVIALARYFSKSTNNQRTIIFAAFTAEEIGEFGSAYFAKKINPDKVVAMLNIEMIGTESKWGKNSAYVTGFEKSDLGEMLMKNLKNSPFKFYPDPYPEQMLFLRSDNASLAKKGVPAHTISTSKMDSEKLYHTPGDNVASLDLKNMAEIIKAIGLSSVSIIAGKDTPKRVSTE